MNNNLLELVRNQILSNVKIEEDPLQLFSSNEPTCESKPSLKESHFASQTCQSPPPIDSEFKTLSKELLYGDFIVNEPDSSNENKTFEILSKPIKCSDENTETKCNICSRQYTNKFKLSLHFLKHAMLEESLINKVTDKYFFCEFCGEVFREIHEVKEHNKHVHSIKEEPESKCHLCEETFEDDISALFHERTENHFESNTTENATYKCVLCPEQCINVSNLLMHSVCHLIKKFDCKDCKKQFISEHSLQNHLESHADFIVECNICKELFTNKYVLDKHLSSAHKIQIVDNHSEANNSNNSIESSEKTTSSDLTDNIQENSLKKTYSCETCRKKFTSSATLKKHMLSYKRKKNYSCTICGESFRWKYYLDRHIISKHKQIRKSDDLNETPKCMYPNCNISFKTSDDLANHVQVHSSVDAFICEVCGKKFSEAGNLRRHVFLHTGIKPFTCEICGRKFRLRQHIRLHMINMHESVTDKQNLNIKMFKCETCKKEFKKFSNFKVHLLSHKYPNPFSCLVCNKNFKSKSSLTLHISCNHKTSESDKLVKTETEEKPYKCTFPDCNKSFTTTSELTNHVRLHLDLSVNPNECKICGRKFSLIGNLKKHMRVHTGERPFPCKVCGKKLSSNRHLKAHMINLHEVKTLDKAQEEETIATYECEKCEKTFSDSTNLKTHMLIHAEQKSFACNLCDEKFEFEYLLKWHVIYKHKVVSNEDNKTQTRTVEKVYKCTFPTCKESFSNATNLTNHVRIHLPLKIKPYDCATCGKTFRELGNLKRHVLVHTDEMPFACEMCDKKFRWKQNLKRHIVRHIAAQDKQAKKQCAADKSYKCTFAGCNKSFSAQTHLTKHGHSHLPKEIQPYECDTCGRKFSEFGNLRRHRNVHIDEKPFICHVCSKQFRFKQNLKIHIITRHIKGLQSDDPNKTQTIDESDTPGQVYKCSFPSCSENFKCSMHLNNRVRNHQPLEIKPYACGTCERKFTVFSNLKRHMLVHSEEKHFLCHVCSKKFTFHQNLNRHIAIRHKATPESDKQVNTQSVDEKLMYIIRFNQPIDGKRFECEICGKTFTEIGNIKRHVLVHTGEMPFACEICNKKFRLKQNLKRHSVRHVAASHKQAKK